MDIKISQTSPDLWGKLGIEETRIAAKKLSGDGFKAWVVLTLNQDGYKWQGDLEPHILQELSDHEYLIPFDNGNYLFRPDGEAENTAAPAGWLKIVELYNSSGRQNLNYIKDKLQSANLDDHMESILSFWAEKYNCLQEIDHSKARNHLKYDFSILLVWWLWGNFRFQAGDVLEVGEGAKLLRFHDDDFMSRIQTGIIDHKITKIHMTEKTAEIWNNAFADNKFEIPLDCVAKILKGRNCYNL